MGGGGQDEPVGKSGITSDEKKSSVVTCHSVVKCPISEVLPDLYYFLYLVWAGTPF